MFHLTRTYSLASLPGIIIVVALLAWYYNTSAVDSLKQQKTEANVALTQAFANSIWPKYAGFISNASGIPKEELLYRWELSALRKDVLQRMRGLPVIKVKIYNLDGLTVFSTQLDQIGEDKSGNKGFQMALAGEVASDISFRDQFDAFEGVIVDRNVLSSYLPIRKAPEEPIEGVFEVYSDVTSLVHEIKRTRYIVIIVVSTVMLLLYGFLLVIVRRGDRIIQAQEKQRQELQEERVRHIETHDALTGLPNRTLYMKVLSKAIKRHVAGGKLLAVILLDLDRFKVVNDSLGHEAGDKVLLETAERLASICGDGQTVARLGGDEFALILENLDGIDRVAHFCDNLIECLTKSLSIAGYEITVSPSMGIAIYPTDAEDADILVKKADTAMNRAKELGRNRYTFVTEELDNRARTRLDMEVGLQKALSKNEFLIHYQPRVEAVSGRILGAEALLRWQRPGMGIVSPVDFIPILEETALIVPVGEWVLEQACRQCEQWHAQGHDNLTVSVNVSVCQFESPTFLSSLKAVLEETGLPPQALELEFTESVFMRDIGEAVEFMNAVKATGVKLAIDDFGTGYSSLSYLTNLPLDHLKIDRAFVNDVTGNKDHANIAQAIALMAKSLDMKIIGEGVETKPQQDYLVELRCDELQGFLFSRPVEAAQFMALLGNEPWLQKA